MCAMLTIISIAGRYKISNDIVRLPYIIKVDYLTLDSNIKRTDVDIKVKTERFKDWRYQ